MRRIINLVESGEPDALNHALWWLQRWISGSMDDEDWSWEDAETMTLEQAFDMIGKVVGNKRAITKLLWRSLILPKPMAQKVMRAKRLPPNPEFAYQSFSRTRQVAEEFGGDLYQPSGTVHVLVSMKPDGSLIPFGMADLLGSTNSEVQSWLSALDHWHHQDGPVTTKVCRMATFLQRAHFVKSVVACVPKQQRIADVPATPTKGRKVKSSPDTSAEAADRHERAKDYLSPGGVAKLLDTAGRHGVRDHLLLLMTYRHGLRVSEAVGLRRDELDLDRARLWVSRLKGGLSVEQPIVGDELRAIKRCLATRTDALPWLFISERCQPLTRQAVNYSIGAAAERASLPGVHPHTLRHSCGFALADKGHDLRLIQDYLGHRDPRHTVHDTRTAGRRFEGLWSR